MNEKVLQGILIAIIILGSGYLVYSFVAPIQNISENLEVEPEDNNTQEDSIQNVYAINSFNEFCTDIEIEHLEVESAISSFDKSQYAYATIDPKSVHIGLKSVVLGDTASEKEVALIDNTAEQYDDGLTPIMFNTAGGKLYVASKVSSSHGGGINKLYILDIESGGVIGIQPDVLNEGHMTAFAKSCDPKEEKIAYAQSAEGGYRNYGPPTWIFFGDQDSVKSVFINTDRDVNSISYLAFSNDRKSIVYTVDRLITAGEDWDGHSQFFLKQRESLWILGLETNEPILIFESDEKYPIVKIEVDPEKSRDEFIAFAAEQYIEAEEFGTGIGPKGNPVNQSFTYNADTQELVEN